MKNLCSLDDKLKPLLSPHNQHNNSCTNMSQASIPNLYGNLDNGVSQSELNVQNSPVNEVFCAKQKVCFAPEIHDVTKKTLVCEG